MSFWFGSKEEKKEIEKEEKINSPKRAERTRNKELLNKMAQNIPKLELKINLDESSEETRDTRSFSNVSEPNFDDTHTEMSHVNSKYVRAIIVAVWDDTTGPKTLRIFHGRENEKLDDDLIQFITTFPLFGEAGREKEIQDKIEVKFNVFSERQLMVLTSYFCAKYQNDTAVFTINLLMDKSMMNQYLQIHPIINEKMIYLGKIFQHLCTNFKFDTSKALGTFNGYLMEFVNIYDSLSSAGLPDFQIKDTVLSKKEDREFIGKVISSHLLMHGYSIVIGEDPNQVNKMVNTLSLFLLSNDFQLCKNVTEKNVFVPELYVQGIVTKKRLKEAWRLIPTNTMMTCRYPFTIIDLIHKQIWRWKGYNHFIALQSYYREFTKKREREKFEKFSDNFQRYSNTCSMVEDLLDVLNELDDNLKFSCIHDFMKILLRKAILLIKFVEKESLKETNGCVNSKVLKESLDFASDVELSIVLAFAEKLKPGVYTIVEGDLLKQSDDLLNWLSEL